MATDTVEAIVAEMRMRAARMKSAATTPARTAIEAWADRLQSAHDAEVGALRDAEAAVGEAGFLGGPTLGECVRAMASRLREAEQSCPASPSPSCTSLT